MDEYISKKEAILAVTRDGCTANVVGVLYHLPTVEAAPKTEGEWASDRADYVCTCCGTRYRDDILFIQAGEMKLPNYCPDCGAKMAKLKEAAP